MSVLLRRVVPMLLGCLVLATAACGSNPSGSAAGASLPTCPATPPSYSGSVAAVIRANCSPCHFPGGSEDSVHDFSTYAAVKAQSGSMLDEVYSGLMPPANAPALSAADSNTLLTWLVCHAPNN